MQQQEGGEVKRVLLFERFALRATLAKHGTGEGDTHIHSLSGGHPPRARGNRHWDSGLSDDAQKSHQKAPEENGIDDCAGQKTIGDMIQNRK